MSWILRWPGWHWVHSFIGLGLSLLLFFLFLTGTLSVFGHEIDWLAHSEMRADPGANQEKLPMGRIYDAARAHLPAEVDIVELHRQASPIIADSVQIRREREALLWVDPYTATIRGETGWRTFHGSIVGLHEHLMLPGLTGALIVTAISIPLTVVMIAGVMLYRRFWTGFFRWPRFSGRTRAWVSDLHRLIAVWLLPFLLAVCLTGIWYLGETVGWLRHRGPEYVAEQSYPQLLPEGFTGAQVDAAVKTAQEKLPGLGVAKVILPRWPHQSLVVWGDLTAVLVGPDANSVHFNPATLDVLGVHRGEEISVYGRISHMVEPIHFGTWGGLPSRILWAVFGLMLCALAALGIVIHVRRIAAMEEKRGIVRSDTARAWRGIGPFGLGAWSSVALILLGLVMLVRAVV